MRRLSPDGAASTTAAAGTAGTTQNNQGAAGGTGAGTGASGQTNTGAAGSGAAGTGAGTGTGTAAAGQAGATGSETQGQAGAGAAGAAAAKKAPAKYELKVPDDAKRFAPPDELEYLEKVARDSDWDNETAQAELDAAITRQVTRFTNQLTTWENETKADKEFGGDKLADTQKLANQAIDKVFPKGHPRRDGFLAFLKESGGGVNVHTVAFLATLGRMMGEDTTTAGRSSFGGTDEAAKFYDHPTSRALEKS